MELFVKNHFPSNNENSNDFECYDKEGKRHYVDLFVDGGIPSDKYEPKDLIGKTVIVDYLQPYLVLANGVRFKEGS